MITSEYLVKLSEITKEKDKAIALAQDNYRCLHSALDKEAAESNNIVCIGDIVEDMIGSIRVSRIDITYAAGTTMPTMRYYGVVDGDIHGHCRNVLQRDVKSINGEPYNYYDAVSRPPITIKTTKHTK